MYTPRTMYVGGPIAGPFGRGTLLMGVTSRGPYSGRLVAVAQRQLRERCIDSCCLVDTQ